ncbi:hypothetical protein ACR3K2_25450 [Cryptosporidium serpentis]
MDNTEFINILRPKYPTHVVIKDNAQFRSSSLGVENRVGIIGELVSITQITDVVFMTFDSEGRLYCIEKRNARECLGELQDEYMNWE